MGGGQNTMENSRPTLDKAARGRGRGLRPDTKRPTVLHTQSMDDMDDINRHALTIARMNAFHSHTARLCQQRCESSSTALDYGPPPLAVDQERLPEATPPALEDQPNQVASALQDALDHHHMAEELGNPIWTGPLSGTRLEPVEEIIPGPRTDHPDQPNLVPSTPQSALPPLQLEVTTDSPSTMDGALVPELSKATGNTPLVPLETSIAPPPQLKGVDTTAPTDNHDCGPPEKKGHIAEGADEGRPKKELKNSKPISRTDPLPDAALNQPATLDPKE